MFTISLGLELVMGWIEHYKRYFSGSDGRTTNEGCARLPTSRALPRQAHYSTTI